MKRMARYISAALFAGLTVVLLFAAYTSEAVKRSRVTCTGIEVVIADSLRNSFVTRADVLDCLKKEYGECTGRALDSIDLVKIEKAVDARSAVRKSEAYLTKDGILHIDVTQREPMVRFQKKEGGFYADEEGFLFPLQSTYTAHVPVIDGAIPLHVDSGYKGRPEDEKEREWTDRITGLVRYMNSSGIWARDIVQITVLPGGDLVLIPREGKEKFLFGQPKKIEEKFRKMEKYYTGIVPEKGRDFYSTVNLKYDRQIICRK